MSSSRTTKNHVLERKAALAAQRARQAQRLSPRNGLPPNHPRLVRKGGHR